MKFRGLVALPWRACLVLRGPSASPLTSTQTERFLSWEWNALIEDVTARCAHGMVFFFTDFDWPGAGLSLIIYAVRN